jgi:3-dehydroquinate dehydratase
MSASRQASSAAEIDNEALRDQVQHLQKQVQSLEDMLEDAQMASEREEATVRERIRRYKEKEEAMKKELSAGRTEVEQMLKSEATARGRVEENEEALRESTLALENARAEIEVLRTEVAVSNVFLMQRIRKFDYVPKTEPGQFGGQRFCRKHTPKAYRFCLTSNQRAFSRCPRDCGLEAVFRRIAHEPTRACYRAP